MPLRRKCRRSNCLVQHRHDPGQKYRRPLLVRWPVRQQCQRGRRRSRPKDPQSAATFVHRRLSRTTFPPPVHQLRPRAWRALRILSRGFSYSSFLYASIFFCWVAICTLFWCFLNCVGIVACCRVPYAQLCGFDFFFSACCAGPQ